MIITKHIFLAVMLTGAVVACTASSEDSAGAGDEQDLTQENQEDVSEQERACKTTADCVAVLALPCCSSNKVAVNEASRDRVEQEGKSLCLVAFCTPDVGPEDARTPACTEGRCVMVDPPPKPVDETVPADRRCAQPSDCVAYEPMPCCSTAKDAVNQAGLAAAKAKAQEACTAAACAPDLGSADARIPACEAGECTLVFPDP